ncbi:MAG: Holliday junction branch migration protein RuvA [Sporolactobacillus sp.]
MFDYIRGLLVYLSAGGIVIEQGGIGYRLVCANPFSYQPLLKQETTVYVYQYVREDAHVLYGFDSRESRELFARLISVTGIGPKIALAIMASAETKDIVAAIEGEDDRYLTRFPGIGKKTAGQMILDLKGKLVDFSITARAGTQARPSNPVLAESGEALAMLGYSEKEIARVLPQIAAQDLTAEGYVKEALRLLMKR